MATTPLDAECRCGHRRAEHVGDNGACVVRQMYGARYSCDCEAFTRPKFAQWLQGTEETDPWRTW